MRTEIGKTFGERLLAIRKGRNFSQRKLASMTVLHFTYVSKAERDLAGPPAASTISIFTASFTGWKGLAIYMSAIF